MKVDKTGVSSAVLGLAVLLVVVIIAAGAYVATTGGTKTQTETTTQTNTATSTITTSTVSTTTASTSSYTLSSPVTLSAGGSSFVNPVMQVWASEYGNLSDHYVSISYQPVGSGAGQTGVLSNAFAFAGSDAPVSAATLSNSKYAGMTLLQIPETLGAVALFYNIPGVTTNLNLDGSTLANIYLQQITFWDDPAITALNPGTNLPHLAIVPVHRSDGSGTTYALSTYLAKIVPAFKSQIGVGTSVNWPTTELAGKGSSQVAGLVTANSGAIGYADTYYAFNNKLLTALVKNSSGNLIAPTLASIASAAADFYTQLQSNATVSIVDAPGAKSYPIATFTYLLVWKSQTSEANAYALANFFWWIVNYGQTYGPGLFYPTLPANVVSISEALIAQINYQGQTFV